MNRKKYFRKVARIYFYPSLFLYGYCLIYHINAVKNALDINDVCINDVCMCSKYFKADS